MSSQRYSPWFGWISGIVAMAAFLGVTFLAGRLDKVVSIISAVADAFLLAMPLSVFARLKDLLGEQAKTWMLVGLVAAFLIIGGWIGGRIQKRVARDPVILWQHITSHSLAFFGLVAVFLLVFVRIQSPDQWEGGRILPTLLALLVASIVFGAVLGMLLLGQQAAARDVNPGRRRALGIGVGAAAALFGAVAVGRDIRDVATRKLNLSGNQGKLSTAITPNEDFYIISKNFNDPTNDRGADWSIEIDGLVDSPMKLTQRDLEALGAETFISTQQCISNPVGGDLIGTAEWTGVPISKVLEHVGAQPDVTGVIFQGADDYSTNVPIKRVNGEESHIIWKMNGEPLPRSHGVPVRATIPGLYGMKSVKWLTRMTATTDDYQGYWERRGWTNIAQVKPMSRIDVPQNGDVLSLGTHQVGGIAFGGDYGLSGVEVSFDDGQTWKKAEIKEQPNPDGIAWTIWTYDWTADTGTYQITVRMIDRDGKAQSTDKASVLPDGASGLHSIKVGVV